jgi:hypothetical protein
MRRVGQLVHFANHQLHNRIAFNRSTRLFRASGATAADQDFLMELRGFEPLTSAEQAPVCGDGAAAFKG